MVVTLVFSFSHKQIDNLDYVLLTTNSRNYFPNIARLEKIVMNQKGQG